MTDSLWEIEAPEPLHKFEGTPVEHPLNLQAAEMHNQRGDIRRILSKDQLRKVNKKLKELNKILNAAGVWELVDQYDLLKADLQEAQAQRYEALKLSEAGEKEKARAMMATARENAASIKEDRKALERRLAPYRDHVMLARRLQSRLDEHHAGLKDEAINKENRARMEKEVNSVAEIVIRVMNGLDFCFRTSHKGKERVVSVGFSRVIVTPDTLQLKLKTFRSGLFGGKVNYIPRGVDLPKAMTTSTVLQQVAASIEMPISCPQVETGRWHEGIWLYVQRNGIKDGLRDKVAYADYIQRYPNDNLKRLPVPTGLKEGMWLSWTNLADQPHLLVTGQNGSGKTNAMLAWLCTLMKNHSPQEVQFIMIDLKEGIDLSGFSGIPHLIGDVIEEVHQAAPVMVAVEKLRAQRMQELKASGARNINDYNARHPKYAMPHIIIVFDEYGALASRAYKEYAETIYSISAQLAMKARAAGIHLIVGAQTPRKEHIPPDVRDNITFRLSGRQATLGGSLAATGTKAASNLDKIPGRFWCEDGRDGYLVQMPYITDDEITDAIRHAMTWPRAELVDLGIDTDTHATEQAIELGAIVVKKEFSVREFLTICLDQLGGAINYTEVYNIAKEEYDVTFRQLQDMADQVKSLDTLEHEGAHYQVMNKGRGKILVETSISTAESMPLIAD